jgi:hybrid cluster-associated redox disulfide protein
MRPRHKIWVILAGACLVKQQRALDPDMPVDEVMRKWPATISVLLKHRMLCVGCPIGPFHSVTEACRAHGLDEQDVITELQDVILEAV